MSITIAPPAVVGGPRLLLRLEGAVIFLLASFAYVVLGFSPMGYFALFLAPDVSFLAYLAGPSVGAFAYNLFHTEACAAVLGVFAWSMGLEPYIGVALIWVAHIGFDRMLGYGLKYASSFQDTHLGALGPAKKAVA
ncbi:MAG: hypothetical protein JWN07_590 [Hyphomicrobiales bacterium]|nr:hypothetical protein [Hyphomicrobiales bacterium]